MRVDFFSSSLLLVVLLSLSLFLAATFSSAWEFRLSTENLLLARDSSSWGVVCGNLFSSYYAKIISKNLEYPTFGAYSWSRTSSLYSHLVSDNYYHFVIPSLSCEIPCSEPTLNFTKCCNVSSANPSSCTASDAVRLFVNKSVPTFSNISLLRPPEITATNPYRNLVMMRRSSDNKEGFVCTSGITSQVTVNGLCRIVGYDYKAVDHPQVAFYYAGSSSTVVPGFTRPDPLVSNVVCPSYATNFSEDCTSAVAGSASFNCAAGGDDLRLYCGAGMEIRYDSLLVSRFVLVRPVAPFPNLRALFYDYRYYRGIEYSTMTDRAKIQLCNYFHPHIGSRCRITSSFSTVLYRNFDCPDINVSGPINDVANCTFTSSGTRRLYARAAAISYKEGTFNVTIRGRDGLVLVQDPYSVLVARDGNNDNNNTTLPLPATMCLDRYYFGVTADEICYWAGYRNLSSPPVMWSHVSDLAANETSGYFQNPSCWPDVGYSDRDNLKPGDEGFPKNMEDCNFDFRTQTCHASNIYVSCTGSDFTPAVDRKNQNALYIRPFSNAAHFPVDGAISNQTAFELCRLIGFEEATLNNITVSYKLQRFSRYDFPYLSYFKNVACPPDITAFNQCNYTHVPKSRNNPYSITIDNAVFLNCGGRMKQWEFKIDKTKGNLLFAKSPGLEMNNTFQPVCSDGFTQGGAQFVCRQLANASSSGGSSLAYDRTRVFHDRLSYFERPSIASAHSLSSLKCPTDAKTIENCEYTEVTSDRFSYYNSVTLDCNSSLAASLRNLSFQIDSSSSPTASVTSFETQSHVLLAKNHSLTLSNAPSRLPDTHFLTFDGWGTVADFSYSIGDEVVVDTASVVCKKMLSMGNFTDTISNNSFTNNISTVPARELFPYSFIWRRGSTSTTSKRFLSVYSLVCDKDASDLFDCEVDSVPNSQYYFTQHRYDQGLTCDLRSMPLHPSRQGSLDWGIGLPSADSPYLLRFDSTVVTSSFLNTFCRQVGYNKNPQHFSVSKFCSSNFAYQYSLNKLDCFGDNNNTTNHVHNINNRSACLMNVTSTVDTVHHRCHGRIYCGSKSDRDDHVFKLDSENFVLAKTPGTLSKWGYISKSYGNYSHHYRVARIICGELFGTSNVNSVFVYGQGDDRRLVPKGVSRKVSLCSVYCWTSDKVFSDCSWSEQNDCSQTGPYYNSNNDFHAFRIQCRGPGNAILTSPTTTTLSTLPPPSTTTMLSTSSPQTSTTTFPLSTTSTYHQPTTTMFPSMISSSSSASSSTSPSPVSSTTETTPTSSTTSTSLNTSTTTSTVPPPLSTASTTSNTSTRHSDNHDNEENNNNHNANAAAGDDDDDSAAAAFKKTGIPLIGVACGILLLILIVLLYKRQKNNSKRNNDDKDNDNDKQMTQAEMSAKLMTDAAAADTQMRIASASASASPNNNNNDPQHHTSFIPDEQQKQQLLKSTKSGNFESVNAAAAATDADEIAKLLGSHAASSITSSNHHPRSSNNKNDDDDDSSDVKSLLFGGEGNDSSHNHRRDADSVSSLPGDMNGDIRDSSSTSQNNNNNLMDALSRVAAVAGTGSAMMMNNESSRETSTNNNKTDAATVKPERTDKISMPLSSLSSTGHQGASSSSAPSKRKASRARKQSMKKQHEAEVLPMSLDDL